MSCDEETRDAVETAARLARTEPVRSLEPLFGELPDDPGQPGVEMRACLLQELALIGARTGRSHLDAYAERLRAWGHPLGRLPDQRLDVEHRFMVRVRGMGPVKTAQQLRSRFPEMPPSVTGAAATRSAVGVPDDTRSGRPHGRSPRADGPAPPRCGSSRCPNRSTPATSACPSSSGSPWTA
ncbi:DUF6183 family protein [Streptomyces albogriseolus]|uniref:DUF6183 family protein n=1 Tax=Streptomyces albogriseolus TaxID=1887 RepID=UPI0034610969